MLQVQVHNAVYLYFCIILENLKLEILKFNAPFFAIFAVCVDINCFDIRLQAPLDQQQRSQRWREGGGRDCRKKRIV